MASSHHTSLDIEALSESCFVNRINERNPCITTITRVRFTSSSCLPICINNAYETPMPTLPTKSPWNLGKTILILSFQTLVALFIAPPSSSPPLLTALFKDAMLICFAVSFIGLFLQNAFPRIAVLLEMISALFAAFSVCIIATVLIHHTFTWICWLVCALSLLAIILSFRRFRQKLNTNVTGIFSNKGDISEVSIHCLCRFLNLLYSL